MLLCLLWVQNIWTNSVSTPSFIWRRFVWPLSVGQLFCLIYIIMTCLTYIQTASLLKNTYCYLSFEAASLVGAMRWILVAVGKHRLDLLVLPPCPHPPLHSWYHEDRNRHMQFGMNSGELLAQEERLQLLGSDSLTAMGELHADFSYG